jgi:xanthine/CO dehydrogenase XdhC/CoxF family maturation factor
VGLLLECGCEVVVVDHRPEQLDILQHWLATRDLRDPGLCLEWSSPFLPELAVRLCLARTAWQQELVHAKPSAVIIMSHHLDWDARYLEAFYAAGFDASSCYLGLLGPNHRSKSVVARLPERFRAFDAGLHSPMGLDLKARGPAAIAVSVVAELLRFWNSRSLGVNHR